MRCSTAFLLAVPLSKEILKRVCRPKRVHNSIMSASYQVEKRTKRDNEQIVECQKIGTHNGTFHCDEVLGCFMLKQLPQFKNAAIVRSRDKAALNECDIVIDVGAVYDPVKHRYDHHQKEFNESMNSLDSKYKWTTKLSSAGLVYFHFGRDVLKRILLPNEIAENTMDVIYSKLYEGFIEEVDAVDNGIDQYDGEPKYHVSTTLGARVSRMNPSWTDEDYNENELFNDVMKMVGSEFTSRVLSLVKIWLPARSLVESAVEDRFNLYKSGEIMMLSRFCPWKGHLFDLEEESTLEPDIKYVIYQDTSKNWRVQCVPTGRNTFENRLSLHSEWRGLRDEKLCQTSGIAGCIFVHASGFIGGNKTKDGAMTMAIKSLEMSLMSGDGHSEAKM